MKQNYEFIMIIYNSGFGVTVQVIDNETIEFGTLKTN